MSIRDILKDLASKHSYVQLHSELLSLMKEEYTALKGFFAEPVEKKRRRNPQPPQEPPQEQEPEETLPLPENIKVLANTKIRIIKKSPERAEPAEPAEPTRMNSKDLKAWQKEQEGKKLAELQKAGVVPESLLTAENIKKWIEEEKRTFAFVAREYLGIPEATVAEFAKKHGVKSSISKKRAILSAKNRLTH
jgi:hypothetical protein